MRTWSQRSVPPPVQTRQHRTSSFAFVFLTEDVLFAVVTVTVFVSVLAAPSESSWFFV